MGQGEKLWELLLFKKIKIKKLAEDISIAPTTLYSIVNRDSEIKDSLKNIIAKQISVNEVAFKHYLDNEITISQLLSINPNAEKLYVSFGEDGYFHIEETPMSIDDIGDLQKELINDYGKLNLDGQQEAVKRVEELTYIPKYKKDPEK